MIIYLEPKTAFSKAIPRSDTLFGAICWAVRLLDGKEKLEELLEKFKPDKAPFVLSSMFPYVENSENKKKFLFLPCPLFPPTPEDFKNIEEYKKNKANKKVKYVSQTVFNAIANGSYKKDDCVVQAGIRMTKGEQKELEDLKNIFDESEAVHNTLNRITYQSKIYYESMVVKAKQDSHLKAGFYFLIKLDEKDKDLVSMLKNAIDFLKEKGIGGNTSIGFGQCDIKAEDEPKDKPIIAGYPKEKYLVTLSLMFPSKLDQDHLRKNQTKSYAQLERRKGFLESSYLSDVNRIWKPTLFMLAEGSVFPRDENRPNQTYGSVHKYADSNFHDLEIRLNGLAYTVGIKERETL
jgi:CRISPR-associated protein Csm4